MRNCCWPPSEVGGIMIYDPKNSTELVDYLRQNGLFVYVSTGKTEPTYIAGPGRHATVEDVKAAIRFLNVILDHMKEGTA